MTVKKEYGVFKKDRPIEQNDDSHDPKIKSQSILRKAPLVFKADTDAEMKDWVENQVKDALGVMREELDGALRNLTILENWVYHNLPCTLG